MATTPLRTYTTLTSRGQRHDIWPMLYHKAKKLGTWDPRGIDLTQDRETGNVCLITIKSVCVA